MTITTDDFAQALFLALQEVRDEDHDRIINNLVEELRLENRLHEFEEIVAKFEELLRLDSEETKTDVKLSKVATANENIIRDLNTQFGGQVKVSTDDKIIGGGIFTINSSEMLDATINKRLQTMEEELSS